MQIIKEAKERQNKNEPHLGGWMLSTEWQKYVLDVISWHDWEAAKRYDTAYYFLERFVEEDCSYLVGNRSFYQEPFQELVNTYFNYNLQFMVMKNE